METGFVRPGETGFTQIETGFVELAKPVAETDFVMGVCVVVGGSREGGGQERRGGKRGEWVKRGGGGQERGRPLHDSTSFLHRNTKTAEYRATGRPRSSRSVLSEANLIFYHR